MAANDISDYCRPSPDIYNDAQDGKQKYIYLTNYLTVNDSLVARLYGGGMGEDGDGCIKLPDSFRMQCNTRQDHPLPDQIPLYLLERHSCSLTGHHLRKQPRGRNVSLEA